MTGLSRCGNPGRDPALLCELGSRVTLSLMTRADWREMIERAFLVSAPMLELVNRGKLSTLGDDR